MKRLMDEFEGMTEEAALMAAMVQGLAPRVVNRDAEFVDYRPHDRVNFHVVDGIVTAAFCG